MTTENSPLLPAKSGDVVLAKKNEIKGLKSFILVNILFWTGIALEVINILTLSKYNGLIVAANSDEWWTIVMVCHIPYFIIILYLIAGMIERIGFIIIDNYPIQKNLKLPDACDLPLCCIQLAMFNEFTVSERIIEQTCKIDYPRDKFEVQVLDDSTEFETQQIVDQTIARMRAKGINITLQRRIDRKGYKAGALEEGRKKTDAVFLALFDADFMPTTDFLYKTLPHFYKEENNKVVSDDHLALVQAQWGHLNAWSSPLTAAQSLWVDDHHSVQMMWRSRIFEFVNFTG
jgi:cellulose synthase/poly-beta-1,6-N-acetylglucosamine synthase-like glycosyltransferase